MNINELTFTNFFKIYSLEPSSDNLTSTDRKIAWVATIALGLFTGGLLQLVTWAIKKCYSLLPSNSKTEEKIDETAEVVTKTADVMFSFDELTSGLTKRSDTESGTLEDAITAEMRAKGIPLVSTPNLPTREFHPNHDAVTEYIDGWAKFHAEAEEPKPKFKDVYEGEFHATEAQLAALKKAMAAVQYISVDQLTTDLQELTVQLNQSFENLGIKSYSAGMSCGKSQQWVHSLALKHLILRPSSWFSLAKHQGTCDSIEKPELDFNLETVKEETIVIYDDCAYTGTQLVGNINQIAKDPKAKKRNVFVVVPYMSKTALAKFKGCEKAFKNFQIFTKIDRPIKLVTETFTPTEIHTLEWAHCFYHPKGGQRFRGYDQTFCYTSWRYPDGTSFVQNFGKLCYPVKVVENEGEAPIWKLKRLQCLPKSTEIPRCYAWTPSKASV